MKGKRNADDEGAEHEYPTVAGGEDPDPAKNPHEASAQIAVPRATKKSRKTLPSSWPMPYAETNRASARRTTMMMISAQSGSLALIGSLIARTCISWPPAARSRLPTQATQPPGSRLTRPPRLYGDERARSS